MFHCCNVVIVGYHCSNSLTAVTIAVDTEDQMMSR